MSNTTQARKIGYAEADTPEWHAMRAGKMSGSRVAAALSLSPWTSRFTLFYQLRGEIPDDIEDNPLLEWGRRLEEPVIAKYEEMHPNVKVIRKPGIWQSKEREWQIASPDALLVMPGADRRRRGSLLEAKTGQYDTDWDDGPPVWYLCQVQHYLDVMGYESAEIAVLFTGNDYREYTVWRNPEDQELLRKASLQILQEVADDVFPDIDGSASTYRTIRRRHPLIDGSRVDVPPELVAEIAQVRAVADRVAEDYGQLINTLAELMGTAHKAFCNNRKVADRRAKTLESIPYVQMAPIGSVRKALQWEQSAQQ